MGARLLDPKEGRDEELDVVIEGGKIARIDKAIASPTKAGVPASRDTTRVTAPSQ